MNFLKAACTFLAAVVALSGALWIAWVAAFLTFGKTYGLYYFALPAFVLALLILVLFWISTRKKGRTVGSFRRFAAISALCLYVTLCIPSIVKKAPTRFDFLGTHQKVFSVEPSWPGLIGTAYTFPANPDRLMDDASSELSNLGYKIYRKRNYMSADLNLGGVSPNAVSVSIYPGRAVGKHFLVDGDMVDTEERYDWATIEVSEPDSLPWWLRVYAP